MLGLNCAEIALLAHSTHFAFPAKLQRSARESANAGDAGGAGRRGFPQRSPGEPAPSEETRTGIPSSDQERRLGTGDSKALQLTCEV